MNQRPLLLIDVDGVLNPLASKPPPGFGEHRLAGFLVRLSPQHGQWLLELERDHNFELVWATSWEHEANDLIGPVIGLPELPVIELFNTQISSGATWKLNAIRDYVGDRPFAWFDDDIGGDGYAWAKRRTRKLNIPTRFIEIPPLVGLRERDIEQARLFAAKVARWQANNPSNEQ